MNVCRHECIRRILPDIFETTKNLFKIFFPPNYAQSRQKLSIEKNTHEFVSVCVLHVKYASMTKNQCICENWSKYYFEQLQSSVGVWNHLSSEMLYGKAHLLMAGRYIVKETSFWTNLKAKKVSEYIALLKKLIESILAEAESSDGLYYCWKWHNKKYIGAIHGNVGIACALLITIHDFFAAELSEAAQRLTNDLKHTIRRWKSPTTHNHANLIGGNAELHYKLVQFCHGEPGIAICLMEALMAGAFKPEDAAIFLKYVQKDAQGTTWQHGLLTKGFSLCHGICGNAYVFLLLHALNPSDGHAASRALHFARHLVNVQTRDVIANNGHIPDHASSLMEGAAGWLCFLGDVFCMLSNSNCPVHFPAFYEF